MTFKHIHNLRNPAYLCIPSKSTQQLRVCLKSLQHIATLVHGCTSESILSHDGEYRRWRATIQPICDFLHTLSCGVKQVQNVYA